MSYLMGVGGSKAESILCVLVRRETERNTVGGDSHLKCSICTL